jgi:soluble lytic murein transglycosylase
MALEQNQNRKPLRRKISVVLIKLIAILLLSFVTAVAYLMYRSHDPLYVVRELKNWTDYRRFDPLIVKTSREYNIDPRLIKAVIWRESQFQSDMLGRHGERGLMQVTEVAARDWAAAKYVPDFQPDQLLQPEMNLKIGIWYLNKAVQRWISRDDAIPFALAEYNAGRTRVDRWIRQANDKMKGQPVTALVFTNSIEFPSTARYVRTILARYDFYKRRGPLRVSEGEEQR